MPGANVFAYDGTGYKPTNRSLTAAIASRTASAYTAVSYAYKLSKVPVAISGASLGTGATNYVTSTPHGFVNGEIIAITGITPSSYNVTAAIMVVNSTQFYVVSFNGSTGGAYASGGVATIVTNVKAVSQIWQGFPPAPSQVTFVQGFNGSAAPSSVNRTTISWTCAAATTLNRFELYQKVGTGAFTAVNTNIGAGVRSYVIDGHAAGTTYTYFIKSVANSGLTLSGAENSFTLSATAVTGVSMSIHATTSSSITYRSTFPAGVWQRVVWQDFGPGYSWTDITSATIGSTATTADYIRTGLTERTGYYSRAVLYDYNNFSMASDAENVTYRQGTTLNQPPSAPTLSSITAVAVAQPAYGSNGGYATSGEVRKSITVGYSIAADTDYKNHSVYLYDGDGAAPVNFITWTGDLTNSGLTSVAFGNLLPSKKYWALVRQRDNNSGETDNATGWQSVTTQALGSFTNANAYDTATGTTYSESASTDELSADISARKTAITLSSNYGGTLLWGGNTGNTHDGNVNTYVAWRVASNASYGIDTVGNINFAMKDDRASFLDYAIYATWLRFTERVHNVVVQLYNSAGTYKGGGAANSATTRNNQPTVIESASSQFVHQFSWASQSIKSTAPKGATTYLGAGNGGQATWNMLLSIRNPIGTTTPYVHLSEYEKIGLQYTIETAVTTYTNTPAVTRYY